MRTLPRLLQASLRRVLGARLLRWAAGSLIVLACGNLAVSLLHGAQVWRLLLLLAAGTTLPIVLCWPVPDRRLLERLRQLDTDTSFEACLEAEARPVRELLRQRALERDAALVLAKVPREPRPEGLRGLLVGAVLAALLAEGISLLVLGRPLSPLEPPAAPGGQGLRIEEHGFSDFATEDPSARRSRLARLEERDEAGLAGHGRTQAARPATELPGGLPGGTPPGGEGGAADRGPGARSGANPAAQSAGGTSAGTQDPRSPRTQGAPGAVAPGREGTPEPGPGAGAQAQAAHPADHTGRGYEHTGDTRIPSPLLDYRARLETRYTERTGRRLALGGHLGQGDLRDFQRRYFESFALRAEVGEVEDPYVSLLKRRWASARGGLE